MISHNHRQPNVQQTPRITMLESGVADRPTIVIQDQGTGQHPDDFEGTLLSLLASNKKSKNHVMGVYNAGGAASYKFCAGAIVMARLAPQLLAGRTDEVGFSLVRYNPLDPDRFKSGVYEFATAPDGSIFRLPITELPELSFGAYIKLVEYLLPRYARGAHEPKQSLWHLFHAALPDPALPFRVIETRVDRFPGLNGRPARRVISGLQHLLGRSGTASYSDTRRVDLGSEKGFVVLRYYVLNDGTEPDAYTTSDQALTVTLNGQRQIVRDRQWLRRNLELFYLYKRLVVLIDGTGLTSAAKRDAFASTRESGVDSPFTKELLDRVLQELKDDEELYNLDELAKQRALEDATRTTTEKVKRQLASQIAAYVRGALTGQRGGGSASRPPTPRPRPRPEPPVVDDSLMLEVPDLLRIMNDPLVVQEGRTAALRLEINAKNDFLPQYSEHLSVVVGQELKNDVRVRSVGRLLGGRVRVTVEADQEATTTNSSLRVALVVPELGVLLTAEGKIDVTAPPEPKRPDQSTGGEPDIDVKWVGRGRWSEFDPPWDGESVGDCLIYRDDPTDREAITRVEWVLNENFGPYEAVVQAKHVGEIAMRTFREGYEYPVLFALFRQRLAEEAKEQEADDEGRSYEVPDDYVKGEKARLARAVLMAMEPEVNLAATLDR